MADTNVNLRGDAKANTASNAMASENTRFVRKLEVTEQSMEVIPPLFEELMTIRIFSSSVQAGLPTIETEFL
jgi:hypothetical protein